MRLSRRGFFVAAVAAVAGVFALTLGAGLQLSRPVPAHIGDPPAGLGALSVNIPSESGTTLRGWFVASQQGRGAILLLPPVRSNRLAMLNRAKWLAAVGYSTLLIDFQATGESFGKAITFGWVERFDVLAAVRFLRERQPGEPVAIIGSSLGGAAALLATPPLRVEALIVEAVYPAIDVAVENRLRMRAGAVGASFAPLLLWPLRWRLGVAADQLRPIDHIADVSAPVFVIGGAADRHTTIEDTRALFEAAREPKHLWVIPGAAHVDFMEAAGDEYRRRVLAFLAAALRAERRAMK